MPVKWEDLTEGALANTGAFSFADGRAPAWRLTLWPNRTLPRRGFVWFIAITFAMSLLPLFAVLGTMVLWGLLPFLMGTLALTWVLIMRNYADGALREVLTIWDDRVELIRDEPRAARRVWQANPHWVRVEMLARGGPVENYVTLSGNGRTVEIGAFLSPDERLGLYRELRRLVGQPLGQGFAARAAHEPRCLRRGYLHQVEMAAVSSGLGRGPARSEGHDTLIDPEDDRRGDVDHPKKGLHAAVTPPGYTSAIFKFANVFSRLMALILNGLIVSYGIFSPSS